MDVDYKKNSERETLIESLRYAATTDRDVVITSKQAEMIVALIDIISHARWDAAAATVLANAVVSSLKSEKVKR